MVDVADHLAAGDMRIQDVIDRLLAVEEVVQVFVEDTAHMLNQILLEETHVRIRIDPVVPEQLGHDLPAVQLDAFKERQVVEAVAVAGDRVLLNAVQLGKGVQQAAGRIADAVSEVIPHIAQRLRHDARRIGEVEDFNVRRSVFLSQLAVFRQRGHRAHGKREPGSACCLLPEQVFRQRGLFVPDAHIVPAHTDRGDDIIRIFHRLYRISGQLEIQPRMEGFHQLRGHAAVNIQLLFVVVHKDDLVKAQFLTALGQALRQEHGADAAAADHCNFHWKSSPFCVLNNRIRSCGTVC